jgi:hypothetical protein
MLNHVLLCRPRGARISVGGGERRSLDVDQIGITARAGAAGLGDQIGEFGALPGPKEGVGEG